jgi:hypothetical protein
MTMVEEECGCTGSQTVWFRFRFHSSHLSCGIRESLPPCHARENPVDATTKRPPADAQRAMVSSKTRKWEERKQETSTIEGKKCDGGRATRHPGAELGKRLPPGWPGGKRPGVGAAAVLSSPVLVGTTSTSCAVPPPQPGQHTPHTHHSRRTYLNRGGRRARTNTWRRRQVNPACVWRCGDKKIKRPKARGC